MIKEIHIARHYGFCMGVKRAINIAEETAQTDNGKVTILNEIVHNEAVVDKFCNVALIIFRKFNFSIHESKFCPNSMVFFIICI